MRDLCLQRRKQRVSHGEGVAVGLSPLLSHCCQAYEPVTVLVAVY